MSKEVLERFSAKFASEVIDAHSEHGDDTAIVKPERVVEMVTWLRDDPAMAFELLSDVTAADYLGVKEPRFEVVYHFYSVSKNHRLRVKVPLEEREPSVPSVVGLYKSALWMEREVWDLYGIVFEGHPDLRRILMYEEFEGHPLRKDYEMEHRQPRIPPRAGQRHL
ncbi:MAG: NADH-quinone oxidoreductase subunit C [Deltaproteobacteria bacterium]